MIALLFNNFIPAVYTTQSSLTLRGDHTCLVRKNLKNCSHGLFKSLIPVAASRDYNVPKIPPVYHLTSATGNRSD
jgi:hypothetical protein